MKKRKLFNTGMLTLLAGVMLVLSFTACGGDPEPSVTKDDVYWSDNGRNFRLELYKSTGKAAKEPGDYVLTVTPGGTSTGKYQGTLTNGAGNITLNNGGGTPIPIAVTATTVTITANTPIAISGIETVTVTTKTVDRNQSGNNPGGGTNYNAAGTWDFTMLGESVTITVTGNNWIFDGPGIYYDDSGTFNRNGNVGTLYSDIWGVNIGTATLVSNTAMTLTLYSPSEITGTFSGTKRDGNNQGGGNNYDAAGTWDFTMLGESVTITVTGNSWVFDGPGIYYDDSGTFNRNGNVGTLYSDIWGVNIGTATLVSNTAMTLTLYSPSEITGTFNGTKRGGNNPNPTLGSSSANAITLNNSGLGTEDFFQTGLDAIWYKFTKETPFYDYWLIWATDIDNTLTSYTADIVVDVYDANLNTLYNNGIPQTNIDVGTGNVTIRIENTGTYYIKVRPYGDYSYNKGNFLLFLS